MLSFYWAFQAALTHGTYIFLCPYQESGTIQSIKDTAVNNTDHVSGLEEFSSSEGHRREANNYTNSWKTQRALRGYPFRVLTKEGVCGIGGWGSQDGVELAGRDSSWPLSHCPPLPRIPVRSGNLLP